MQHDESRSDSGLPEGEPRRRDDGDRERVGRDVSGPETDDAMTRSEEELNVGTAKRETGRARLVKHVVTEDVQTTVPVSREEVRIEREPITEANRDSASSGGEITEGEHEVVLHEEQAVIEKTTVPKERVRMDKDVVTDEPGLRDRPQGADRDRGRLRRPPVALTDRGGRPGRPATPYSHPLEARSIPVRRLGGAGADHGDRDVHDPQPAQDRAPECERKPT